MARKHELEEQHEQQVPQPEDTEAQGGSHGAPAFWVVMDDEASEPTKEDDQLSPKTEAKGSKGIEWIEGSELRER